MKARLTTWDDIRFFLAIHRAGSLSAAAKPLGVTQPTCGRRLAALEDALHVRLFDRTPDGLRITMEGEALLESGLQMERDAEQLELRATATHRELEGAVRIGTNELFTHAFLVPAMETVRRSYPAIRLELVVSNAEADLLRRDVDLAIRFRPKGVRPTPDTLVARKLGDIPYFLFAADGYLRERGLPAQPDDLEGHDVIAFTGNHPAVTWCARAFRRATIVLSTSSMPVVGAAIAAGLGLGVLPALAPLVFPLARPISAPIAYATGWLVIHPDLGRVPRIRAIADMLVALYALRERR